MANHENEQAAMCTTPYNTTAPTNSTEERMAQGIQFTPLTLLLAKKFFVDFIVGKEMTFRNFIYSSVI